MDNLKGQPENWYTAHHPIYLSFVGAVLDPSEGGLVDWGLLASIRPFRRDTCLYCMLSLQWALWLGSSLFTQNTGAGQGSGH